MIASSATRRAPVGLLAFNLLAILVGLVAGFGAVAFRGLIAVFHNLLFLGQFSLDYDANVHTPPSPWGIFVVLVPVVGAAGVVFLVGKFAPEAKGHGVPEVMDAIYYDSGVIRPIVALIKALASALSIGSGGSIGREGPIIQIGASFGSTMGQLIAMPPWQRITLIAAGAGAGIAATFNTPIGGVLFAVEIMLHEVSGRTLIPLAISTATATYVGRRCFGPSPSFVIPALETPYFHVDNAWLLLAFVGLGTLLGFVSIVYIKSIYAFEDFFDQHVKGGYYTRHMLGMFLVGIMMYLMMARWGHYYIEGVGYAAIQDVLVGSLSTFDLLLLLFALKLLATSLTLGSGASGGIFSPSLFMGATLGAAYGIALNWCFPELDKNVSGFAVAGMAGVVGGATGAAMAAIVMIFEMTLDYGVIIPITITVALSYGIRRVLCPESIYTLKLARRGHHIPSALHASVIQLKRAQDIMQSTLASLPASTSLDCFAKTALEHPTQSHFLIHDTDRVVGLLGREAALAVLDQPHATTTVGQVANTKFIVVSADATLADLLAEMYSSGVSTALVAANGKTSSVSDIRGMITEHETAQAMIRSVELF
ncbi:MAG TPA: chloride channel protein [Pirellulales bacterium]|jgi:CIC family chloride channel protein|nr:chloride channel protein [Pirellulales bacterium]